MEINYTSESSGKEDCRWMFNKPCGGFLVAVRYEPLVIALYQGPRFAIAGIQYRSTVISPYNKMRAEAPQNSFQKNRNAPVDGYSVASRGHTLGSRSFAAAIAIEANKPNGKVPDFYDRYMASHTLKDGGWIDPQCEEIHARMVAMRDEASQSGCLLTDEELSRSNLGEAKYYVRGFGVGPRPSSFSSQSSSNSARQELQKVQSEMELLREERRREREEYERRWEEERNRRDEEQRQREEQQRQSDEELRLRD